MVVVTAILHIKPPMHRTNKSSFDRLRLWRSNGVSFGHGSLSEISKYSPELFSLCLLFFLLKAKMSLTACVYGGQTVLVMRHRGFVFIKPLPWFCCRAFPTGGQTVLVMRHRGFVFIKPLPWFCCRAFPTGGQTVLHSGI